MPGKHQILVAKSNAGPIAAGSSAKFCTDLYHITTAASATSSWSCERCVSILQNRVN
ncbi:hypothetical protein FA13DRAFT_1119631 [Coprinellus micaceus]|uniref:Uncharacterized protein n=1 Tax=Coprinellus micaceus TaxID=71717 RepID=A0A4Y7RK84_COPMI|nr:hypothetical protein FA13DRAFT_1119631 [Coprinellus micaceus]